MVSFDNFWNNTVVPDISASLESVIEDSKTGKSTAELTAEMVAIVVKTAFADYHSWLSSQLPQISQDHPASEE